MTEKRAFITGISGQDGLYLAELLVEKGYEVFGLVRDIASSSSDVVRATIPTARLLSGDLTDAGSLSDAIQSSRPHEIYNLGAMSFVGDSWSQASLTTEVTAKGVLNLLEATRRLSASFDDEVRFYQASSSEMFGHATQSPQDEQTAFWPRSPYGVAKAFGHHMTINFRESYGMHASSGILFNHESPRRGDRFVTKKIAKAVARIHLGLQDTLTLGNLETQRDWGFAGDYVEAMWMMLQEDSASDYVIATGKVHSLSEFAECAFSVVGIENWLEYITLDPGLARPADIQVLVGDPSKAKENLGWQPKVGFDALVSMMVESELSRARETNS